MGWLWALFLPAVTYQALSSFAILRFLKQRTPASTWRPGVSVLKPVAGLDPNTLAAFRSQAQQNYPEFEILFGVRDPNDPVIAAIEQLRREFPGVDARLIRTTTDAPNRKVGSLIDLAKEARFPIWLVNDGDIAVTPSYLRDVVGRLADSEIGVVTCPYRAEGHSLATRWESLGITTDFMPSTMVAQMLGVRDFGLGATLAFRAADLLAAGGFESFAQYIADDFQLAHRISRLGKRALLSRHVVATTLGDAKWSGVWRHQLRWARTIRFSKGAGYAGLPITHAGIWSFGALCFGMWPVAAVLYGLRVLAAILASIAVDDGRNLVLCWLAPVWDLFAFAIWTGAWTGRTVHWRGRRLRLNPDGTISE